MFLKNISSFKGFLKLCSNAVSRISDLQWSLLVQIPLDQFSKANATFIPPKRQRNCNFPLATSNHYKTMIRSSFENFERTMICPWKFAAWSLLYSYCSLHISKNNEYIFKAGTQEKNQKFERNIFKNSFQSTLRTAIIFSKDSTRPPFRPRGISNFKLNSNSWFVYNYFIKLYSLSSWKFWAFND